MSASDSKRSSARAPASTASTSPAGDRAAAPPKKLLTEIGDRLAHAVRTLRGSTSIRESLEEVIEESDRETQDLSGQERFMLSNLLRFGDLKVEDVMVPRANIIAVEATTTLPELLKSFREAQHSRLPIYRETLDDPSGMIHIKDVIAALEVTETGEFRWPETAIVKLQRDVLFVPGAMTALDLLLRMQASHIHLALVIDEYGGTDGLVSIEDLVEEIVGEIDDEHDVDEEPKIISRGDGIYDADARIALEDFKERTGIDLLAGNTDEDVDTLGGLVFAELGRVPVRGEIVVHSSGIEFEVLEADPRRVRRVLVRPTTASFEDH